MGTMSVLACSKACSGISRDSWVRHFDVLATTEHLDKACSSLSPLNNDNKNEPMDKCNVARLYKRSRPQNVSVVF